MLRRSRRSVFSLSLFSVPSLTIPSAIKRACAFYFHFVCRVAEEQPVSASAPTIHARGGIRFILSAHYGSASTWTVPTPERGPQ